MICLNCGCKLELGVKFCTNCGKETSLADPNKTGKITVIREKKVFAFAIPFDVYIDDNKLGSLKNGETLTCPASLDMHEIVLKSTEKDVVKSVTLSEDKKEVTIRIIPKLGIIAARPFVKEITYN